MNSTELELLKAEVEVLLELLRTAYRDYLFLKPMLVSRDLHARLDGTKKGPSFNRLRTVLYWDFVQKLVKVCDDRDRHGRTTSIRTISNSVLQDSELQSLLEEQYLMWSPPRSHELEPDLVEQIKQRDQQKARQRFRERLARLQRDVNEVLSSRALHSYIKVRNKLIAHTEIRSKEGTIRRFEVQGEGLKFGDERNLLEKAIVVIDDLYSLVNRSELSWESDRKLHTTDGCAFWEIDTLD